MTPDPLWLVTTADAGGGPTDVGHAAFLEAADEAEAVTAAAHLFLDETDHDACTLSDVGVLGPFDELPPRWRIVLGAEPLPKHLWCCGGMPHCDRPGSTDEHAATCKEAEPR